MSKKKIKIGIAAALSGIAVSPVCSSSSSQNKPENSSVEVAVDSLSLENRLKEIAADTTKIDLAIGAMCYKIAATKPGTYKCRECGRVVSEKYSHYMLSTMSSIIRTVDMIRAMGYDVVVDQSEFCPKCSKHRKVENPELIFKIRFSKKAEYHVAKSNVKNDYVCLYEFLSGNQKFADRTGNEYLIRDNIPVIQKMTGLGSDLKIEE